jgi:type III secretory pathway component EscT
LSRGIIYRGGQPMPGLAELLAVVERTYGVDGRSFLVAWARALPVVTVVPAFGLAAVAVPIRVVLGATMAVAVAPQLRAVAAADVPLPLLLVTEAARTVPLALATSALLWAAVMAGGLVDNLRGARENAELPLLDEPGAPFSALFGLLMAIAFLETGGASRLAVALSEPRLAATWAVGAERLSHAMGLAVALAAPLAIGSVLVELTAGLIARAASPAFVLSLLAPLRSLALLVLVWLSLDRIVELFVVLAAAKL